MRDVKNITGTYYRLSFVLATLGEVGDTRAVLLREVVEIEAKHDVGERTLKEKPLIAKNQLRWLILEKSKQYYLNEFQNVTGRKRNKIVG
jgi:hypothetical protein